MMLKTRVDRMASEARVESGSLHMDPNQVTSRSAVVDGTVAAALDDSLDRFILAAISHDLRTARGFTHAFGGELTIDDTPAAGPRCCSAYQRRRRAPTGDHNRLPSPQDLKLGDTCQPEPQPL
jgi:hypothetical protein